MPEQNYDSSTATVGMIAWDSHWLTLLKEMHEPTWDDLVTNYAADLRHDIGASLRKRGLSPDLVEDVEQETWRIAVQKIGEFNADTIDKLYNWLRVIALNRIRMMKRQQKDSDIYLDEISENEFEGGVSLDHFLFVHDLSDDSPESIMLVKERLGALEVALQELSPRDREIVLRRWLWGEAPRELALDYYLSPRTISMILLRAKQTLEQFLADMD